MPSRIERVLRVVAGPLLVWAVGVSQAGGQLIREDHCLVPSDVSDGDLFGSSVAIEAGLVAAGSPGDDEAAFGAGSAYLFDAGTGAELAKLVADDGAERDGLGFSIALGDGFVFVGAPHTHPSFPAPGAAYLFDSASGEQTRKFLGDGTQERDLFGFAVGIGGGVVAVGAPEDASQGAGAGAVYLFDAAAGTMIVKITPDDAAEADRFGRRLAMGEGLLVVSSVGDDENGEDSGSAYVFDASSGDLVFKILPGDGSASDGFGEAVAVGGGVVCVGAPGSDEGGNNSGAVYVFDATTGLELAKLRSPDSEWWSGLGSSVAIQGRVLVAGATGDLWGGGSAYVFDVASGEQLARLLPSEWSQNDRIGGAVGLEDGRVIVGANGVRAVPYAAHGAAYLFNISGVVCPVDLIADGALDFFDIQAFLNLFAAGDSVADWNGDGVWDFFDLQGFLADFAAGCP